VGCNIRVFGSVARGDTNQDSDIDFLIDLGENLSPWFPVRLIRDLENLLGRKVDIVTEKGLKERIRERVLKEAVPLGGTIANDCEIFKKRSPRLKNMLCAESKSLRMMN
jgi:hypothetical protein